jgi:predicted permease
MIGDLVQDTRYGLRMLRKSPGFSLVAILSLALGIGANTAIFTLLNAVLLKTLPVKAPDQLVLFSTSTGEGTSYGDPPRGAWRLFSYPAYDYLRTHTESFEGLTAFRSGEARLSVRVEGSTGDSVERAQGHLVTGNYFEVLGVKSTIGRVLSPADDTPASRPVAVISHRYWKEHCNSDPSIVGRNVSLNGTSFTIVGVTPPEFFGERVRLSPDYWMPIVFQPQIEMRDSVMNEQNTYWLSLMARLKPGTTRERAQAEVNVALRQFLTEQAGQEITDERRVAIDNSYIELSSGSRGISGLRFYYSQPLQMLMAIVGLVLLIACANVGNLLLSRSASRQTEMSLRLALGASRARIVRQLLTESTVLAVMGGVLGLLLAGWGVDALVTLVAKTTPLDVHPDAIVLGFTIGVSLLSGVVFGLAPALRASRTDLATTLKARSSRTGGLKLRLSLAPALIVGQVAVSLVLLVGAGLFARSLLKLQSEDLGFNRDNVLLIDIDPRLAGYKAQQLSGLYRQLLERINVLPGVRASSIATYSPLSGSGRSSTISVSGYTPRPDEDMDVTDMLIGPGYCETLGLPIKAGREIGFQDSPASTKIAVINESFAKKFFEGENPIGRRFGYGGDATSADFEIVGVIGDVRYERAQEAAVPTVYRSILQAQGEGAYSSNLEIRTEGDPLTASSAVRSAIAQVDDKLPVVSVTSFSRQLADSLKQERLMTQLVSFFGALALVLASVGLYGVMGHAVARRTNEIGIRMALGAERSSILWMVLRETLLLVATGIGIGVPVALAAARLVSAQLYGLSAADPLTLVGSVVVLIGVAALAGYLPARRASLVDPMVALRYE